jgi:drug/metabolite transporter (DMT)-like permease
MSKEIKIGAYFIALIGAILFSSKAILVKLGYILNIDKVTLLTLRMGFALPVYVVVAFIYPRHAQNEPIKPKHWMGLVLFGIIGYYFASFLDFWGLQFVNPGIERLILFCYPTITAILSFFVFKQKLSIKSWVAILICYIGLMVALWENLFIPTENFWLGFVLIFGSALTFSFYLIGSQKLIPVFGVQRFTSYCMIVSCVAVLIHFEFSSDASFDQITTDGILVGIGMAIFATVLPSFMMSYAISKIGASSTALLSSVGPIAVLIMAYFILGDPITIFHILGTIIVIAGVLMIKKG